MDKPFSLKQKHQLNALLDIISYENGKTEDHLKYFLELSMKEFTKRVQFENFNGSEDDERTIDFASFFISWQLDLEFKMANTFLNSKFLQSIKDVLHIAFNFATIISIIGISLAFIIKIFS